MLPIPGTGSIAHLDENCGGASVQLDELAISEINDLGKDLV
jgi:aryl-alcohol dehydrogenase-like predicted oxidoreductase